MGLAVKIRVGRQGLLSSFPGLVAADELECVSVWLFFCFVYFFVPSKKKTPGFCFFCQFV